jgi:hypothetical protein
MIELWNNIIYESSLAEKLIEYYENKKKEIKQMEDNQKKEKESEI